MPEDNSGPYNPISIPNVALSLALEVLEQEPILLSDSISIEGPGIYLLYYAGDFDLYSLLAPSTGKSIDAKLPIYVGRAVRRGSRKGYSFEYEKNHVLRDRLRDHIRSIDKAENLRSSDFACRFLVVEDAFIHLAESVLISVFRPLWNQVVDGFGNNPTGGPRSTQAKSDWDVLHPGRVRGQGPPRRPLEEIKAAVTNHLQANLDEESSVELERIRKRIHKYSLG